MHMRKLVLLVPSLLFLLAGGLAQNISGKVTDTKGAPIPGATIKEKGTKTGTAADDAGAFQIKAANGAILIVSATGFQQKEVAAAANLVIELISQSMDLTEVVITA